MIQSLIFSNSEIPNRADGTEALCIQFVCTHSVPNCAGNVDVLFPFPVSLLSMSSSAIHLTSPVCMALGHVFQGGPLPLKERKAEDVGDSGEGLSTMELIKCLRKVLEGSKDIRVWAKMLSMILTAFLTIISNLPHRHESTVQQH